VNHTFLFAHMHVLHTNTHMYRAAAGSTDPSHKISPLDQKLLDACGIGDFEEAKSLLEQGASVDAVSAVCFHFFLCMIKQKAGQTQHFTAHARTHTHTHTHTLGRR
jgi:hypothetical protein